MNYFVISGLYFLSFFIISGFLDQDPPGVQQNLVSILTWTGRSRGPRLRPLRGRLPSCQNLQVSAASLTLPRQRGGARLCRTAASRRRRHQLWRMTWEVSGRDWRVSGRRRTTSAAPRAAASRNTCLVSMTPWNFEVSWPARSRLRTAARKRRSSIPSGSSGSSAASSSPCLSGCSSASIWWVCRPITAVYVRLIKEPTFMFVFWMLSVWLLLTFSFQSIFAPFLTLELAYMGLSKYFPKVSFLFFSVGSCQMKQVSHFGCGRSQPPTSLFGCPLKTKIARKIIKNVKNIMHHLYI